MKYKLTTGRGTYDRIDLSDKETVKSLLLYQSHFKYSNYTSNTSSLECIASQQEMYTDLMVTYIVLEEIIEECNFTGKSHRLMRLIGSGYTISYIYSNFENYRTPQATFQMLDRIVDKICNRYLERQKEGENYDDIAPQRGREGVKQHIESS